MNLQAYQDMHAAPDLDVFERRLVDIAHRLDFGIVTAAFGMERPGESPRFAVVGNAPKAFQEAERPPEVLRRDPVLMRLKDTAVPFVYDQDFYVDKGCGDLWEEQAPFGFRTGISMAHHLPDGQHFLLGVDRDAALPKDDTALSNMLGQLQLLAVFAQEAALRLLRPRAQALWDQPNLTPREREVLKWTQQGKSAWAVGQLLSMSEHTVNFHLRNAMRKLESGSKHQAVLRAIEFGLI